MSRVLVSVGTDGLSDWVETPDKCRHNLGSLSVLNFVRGLAKNSREARRVLDEFLEQGQSMLSVNVDHMGALLAGKKYAANSLIDSVGQRQSMKTISDDLHQAELLVHYLSCKAAKGVTEEPAVKKLVASIQNIRSPNQSQNSTYYGFGAPPVHTVQPQAEDSSDDLDLAQKILDQVERTLAEINAKVSQGRRFNANRARLDVRSIASKVASLCDCGTDARAHEDLLKLASESERIYRLFHPKG